MNTLTVEELEQFILDHCLEKEGYDDDVCTGCENYAHYDGDTDRIEVAEHEERCIIAQLRVKHAERLTAERNELIAKVAQDRLDRAAKQKANEEARWNALTSEQQTEEIRMNDLKAQYNKEVHESIRRMADVKFGFEAWLERQEGK